MKITRFIALAALTMLLFACEKDEVFMNDSMVELKVKAPTYVDLGNTAKSISSKTNSDSFLKSSETHKAAVYMAEYITAGDSDEMGNIVFFMNVGNKKLDADFVPGLFLDDTDGTDDISYYVDDNRPSDDLLVGVTNNAIDRAMTTWDGVTCSETGMFEADFNGEETGFIAAILRDVYGFPFKGSYDYFADVIHAGWMPFSFFEFIGGPGGGSNILGVTFTIIWTDENDVPTDVDNNGKLDVAWREIYYNDAFTWKDGDHYDVETIALHEAGHGLSQGHFGKAFRNIRTGKLHFAPRALMNAGYSGIQTAIGETDNAGHCANWASWPSN